MTEYHSMHPDQVTREQAMAEVTRITVEYQKYRSMLIRNSHRLRELEDENKTLHSLVAEEGGALVAALGYGQANLQMSLEDFLAALRCGKHLKP